MIPWHVDYDVNYGVRCIVPIYGNDNVINLFKRNNKIDIFVINKKKMKMIYRSLGNALTKPART